MNEDWNARLVALRRAFDETFTNQPDERPATEDFLAIRVAEEPFALRLTGIERLAEGAKIVSVPSSRPCVLGVASVRGTVVAVHSLAVLLGYAPGPATWLAVVHGLDVAVAFDALEGFLRAPRGTSGALRIDGTARPILDMNDIVRMMTTGESGQARSRA